MIPEPSGSRGKRALASVLPGRSGERFRRQARQHSAVASLGRWALTETSLDRLFARVCSTIPEVLDLPLAAILRDTGDGRLAMISHVGWGEARELVHRTIPKDPSLQAGYVLNQTEVVTVADTLHEGRFAVPPVVIQAGIRASISSPVFVDGRPWGLVSGHDRTPRVFTRDEIEFLAGVAEVVAAAIERHQLEEEIRHQALHEPLTGLPNRTLVLDRLRHALAGAGRRPGSVGVMIVDLDRFKLINDSLGHEAGDQLLASLAPRLRNALRPADTIGRLGGDEFAIVCEDLDSPLTALEIASRVQEAIKLPIAVEGRDREIDASIGIALDQGSWTAPEELMRDADTAMYRAKESGRGRIELFDEQLRQDVLRRMQTEAELRTALARGEIVPYYQPTVCLESKRIVALEALARWNHPERGLLPPAEFIEIAEESGLIAALGEQILELACRDVAAWQRRYPWHAELNVCVNVSETQVASPGFAGRVAATASDHGLARGTLALEVTESVLLKDAGCPAALLDGLRQHDLQLVLDDFGTGYSSLSCLNRFTLDALKIDRSFIAGICEREREQQIITAVVGMAKALGMQTIAEGVEDDAQAECLRAMGCERAQGFLFSRPLPPVEIEQLLERPEVVWDGGDPAAALSS